MSEKTETVNQKSGPVVLTILDGWGLSSTQNGNAIFLAKPECFDRLWREYPHAVLHTSNPQDTIKRRRVGTSDISHAMLGSGRQIKSDQEDIDAAIDGGYLDKNPVLTDAFRLAVQRQKTVHFIGLASDSGLHSDLKTVQSMLALAKKIGVRDVVFHLILDGRDAPQRSGIQFVQTFEQMIAKHRIGRLGSFVGRHYAMDRDGYWDRTLVAYRLWVEGIGTEIANPIDSLIQLYESGEVDEKMPPHLIRQSGQTQLVQDGDVVVVWNARPDRLGQLTQAFVDPSALRATIKRKSPIRKLGRFVTLVTPYLSKQLKFEVAFPPSIIRASLGEILSGRGYHQLRAAESDKATHVTYFFNGGRMAPFPGEERLIVSSPRTNNYAQVPGTSVNNLVKDVLNQLRSNKFDFVVLNLANVDLVGHSGDLFATIQAVKIADKALSQLVDGVLGMNGTVVLTADHGNAEQMVNIGSNDIDRAHTANPVPFILINQRFKRDLIKQATVPSWHFLGNIIRSKATLADVAPTVLELFGIPVPVEMSGQSLLKKLV